VIIYDHADRTPTVRRQAAEWAEIKHCLRQEGASRMCVSLRLGAAAYDAYGTLMAR
jgi:hypothetical protein